MRSKIPSDPFETSTDHSETAKERLNNLTVAIKNSDRAVRSFEKGV
ncbi:MULTISPECIES: hypothetical protein [unclassified Chryseobacterium]|nr:MULTISPECIES: hypothetical protein [unclassified Chryseobacterium]